MNTLLQRYGVNGLWHFTDKSNLNLIELHGGLLSWRESQRRGVVVPSPGGNDWSHDADRLNGVSDYVHLAFLADHPMQFIATQDGRIKEPIWLKIDLSVLLEQGVRYSCDVSNKAGVPMLSPEEAKEQIDFEVLFTRTDWKDPEIQARRRAALKSEVLVPKLIPLDKIIGCFNG